MREYWRTLPGTCVLVSNMGNVKSCGREKVNSLGVKRFVSSKPYKASPDKDGYLRITVHFKEGQKRVSIHKLVAMLFLRKRPNSSQVNHKNGVKSDNRASNLEWCTPRENIQHSYRIGLVKNVSDLHYNAKLTNDIVRHIRIMFASGILDRKALSEKFGVSKTSICKIINRESWKRI